MSAIVRSISRCIRPFRLLIVWLLLAGLVLAGCDDIPPPPLPRPVEEVMQDFTLFTDPVSMLSRPQ
jgi:hypothetical protein